MRTEIVIALAAGIILFIAVSFFIIRKYIHYMIDRRTLLYQSDLMEKHFEEVQNMYRQTRGWRHDYHNHIQTMKAYLALGQYDEIEEYLNRLDTDLTTVDTVIKTGNVMIDAILNSKISLAKNRNIKVDAKAIVPKNLPDTMSQVDLSLVIGNLMDNAMEACMDMEDEDGRFIRIYIDILKGQLYIYIMNSAKGVRKRDGRIYISTKNERNHGFGLMRIDRVVDKYGGYLERQDEDGVFATEIMLPLQAAG